MKKVLCMMVVLVLSAGLLIGCSTSGETNGDQVDTGGNENGNRGEQPALEDKNFESISYIDNIMLEMYGHLDEALDSVNEESGVLDKMAIIDATAPIGNALFNCRPMESEEWSVEEEKMLTGFDGVYSGSLKKEGNIYKYNCIDKYAEGYVEKVSLDYDIQKNIVEYIFESDQEMYKGNKHMQFYVDKDNNLFIVGSDYEEEKNSVTRFVLYYDGKSIKYGIDYNVNIEKAELPVNIIDSTPSSWEELKGDKEYDSVFIYDGEKAEYIKNGD